MTQISNFFIVISVIVLDFKDEIGKNDYKLNIMLARINTEVG